MGETYDLVIVKGGSNWPTPTGFWNLVARQDQAGLQQDDIIVPVGEQEIISATQPVTQLFQQEVGRSVQLFSGGLKQR